MTNISLKEFQPLINRSVFILRETKSRFKNPAILWSTGKDSTAILGLCKDAFFGQVPFDVVYIDTGFHFPQLYEFRDRMVKEWNLNLVIAKNESSLFNDNMNPKNYPHFECCNALKTHALKYVVEREKYDALILGIRWDEHGIRGKERYFSPRDSKWHWRVSREKSEEELKDGDAPITALQDTELAGWGIYATDFGPECSHVRVHPILHFDEIDVWHYIKIKELPYNPLYESKNGKRYRSLGCVPCTSPVESKAQTIDDFIEEIHFATSAERAGRLQIKEKNLMERLRYLGYM